VLSSILIPLVGYYYAERQKDKEIDKGFVELGIKILSENPTAESKPLREWAIALINNYSEVKLSESAQQLIVEKAPLVTSGDRGISPQVLDRLQSDGFSLGVIVSQFNHDVDFSALKTRQIKFVYVRATRGERFVDGTMERHVREASRNGLYVGLYHFFEYSGSGADPIKQADSFWAALMSKEWNLPPVVDCELGPQPTVPSDYADRAYQFIQRLQTLSKMKPIIYSNTQFADQHFDERFSAYPIFLARFVASAARATTPIAPKWWKDVTFWHLADSVKDPALANLDIVGFKGNDAMLKALLNDSRTTASAN
jgi:GH25 family lysozyme M1 (1,4-beta-N-acetylmuramidase)